ncbi:MAG: PEGA domain-containing protein [Clostridia bacterium]|jgi:hypothetical protein|nr:PEGA domain-containing protein [Clostridia bacterium]MCI2015960.1 PEGA domain-containing protein [Clostridia bacterium]
MANFHFENDNKDLGETRRIDDINKQIQQIDNKKKKSEIPSDNNVLNKPIYKKKEDKERIFSLSVKTAIVLIIVAFIFIIGIGFMLFSIFSETGQRGNSNAASSLEDDKNPTEEKQIDYAFITSLNENEAEFYSLSSRENIKAPFSPSVVITGTNGGRLSKSDLRRGQLVSVDISKEGKISCIRWPNDAWHIDSTTGVKVDTDAKTFTVANETYNYDSDSMFLYNGNDIYPRDINESDTVTLFGVNGKLYSAIVEHIHGNIILKNTENIKNLSVFVDLVHIDDIKNMTIPVSAGKHNVVISGTNISDFLCSVDIKDNDSVDIDLAGTADNKRIIISSNAKDYTVNVNGNAYAANTSEIAVKQGIYDVTVSAPGYKSKTFKADCTSNDAIIDAELENTESGGFEAPPKSDTNPQPDQNSNEYVTINSNPGWARIYVDGKYIGISPVMVSLTYGQHTVTAQLDGRDNIYQDIQVNGPDKVINMDFDK